MTVHGIYNRIRRPFRQLMGTTVSKTNGKNVLSAEGSIAVDDDDDAGGIRKRSLPQNVSGSSSRPTPGPRMRSNSGNAVDSHEQDDVLHHDAYFQPKQRIDTALALDRCFGRASPLKGTPPPAPPLAGSLSSIESVDSPLTSPETSPSGSPATPEPPVGATLPSPSSSSVKKSKLPLNSYIRRICMNGVRSRGRHFCMSIDEIRGVCQAVQPILLDQPALLELATPVKVVGDIHGQFQDLLRIFQKCGMPPKTNYLFLGDYVDRGKQSLETIMLLLCLKLRYPGNVFLLRGNHESANVTKVYGFYDECKRRSSVKSWRSIVDVFNSLPIAATIGGKIFCVHGGLSPDLERLGQISKVQRPTDIPDSGLVSDLLWSDPDPQTKEWGDNDRGVSFCFGTRVLDQFCKRFEFDLVARGHMVVQDGYEFFGRRRLVTVFSAPNYCGEFENWGAVMSVDEDLLCSFELLEPK